MEDDTKTPTSMEEDDEVKHLLVEVSKEAEKRAYLEQSRKNRNLSEDKGKPCS